MTSSIAIVQSALFGTNDSGAYFNDLEVHGGSANVTIDTDNPIQWIHFACGDVIDGFTVRYKVGTSTSDESHGTIPDDNDTVWFPAKQTKLEATKETIIAVSGQACVDANSKWGKRIVSLSFTTIFADTGEMKVYGPYGGANPNEAVTIARLFKQIASRRKLPFKQVFNLNRFNGTVRASRPFNPRFKQCLNGSKRHFAPGFELVPQAPAYISGATEQQVSNWANQE
ncbi:hypothetical protein C8J57DRAFT_1226957 [Mycena rebaudengoi]|nr:hypothetical protein C8J57DRAFT_1226957 [Mycena rebaudengoi]